MFLKRLNTVGDVVSAHLNPACTFGSLCSSEIVKVDLLTSQVRYRSAMPARLAGISKLRGIRALDEFDG